MAPPGGDREGHPAHTRPWSLVAPAAGAAPAAAVPAAPAAPAAAVLARPGIVDGEAAAADHLAVEGGDGGLGLLVAAHLDEAEPLRPARVTVHDDLRRLHRAVRREHLLQRAVGHVVGQVADVQLL